MGYLVIVLGLMALTVLAVVIGLSDTRARNEAWLRIATARRLLVERRHDLDAWEHQLKERERRLQVQEGDEDDLDPT